MNLLNVASRKLNAEVVSVSSSDNHILHNAENILDEDRQTLWVSAEGLPQFVTISLEKVRAGYANIVSVAIMCSHDYETNPKTVEIWVSNSKQSAIDEQFIHWSDVSLRKKSGLQMFSIDSIPDSYRIIKIVITETFGEFQTYLNQILLLAEKHPHSGSQQKESWNSKRFKSPKIDHQYHELGSPLNFLALDQIHGEGSPFSIDNSQASQHFKKYNEATQQKNAHSKLSVSQNLLVMEDNIEELNRRMSIIEQKVDYFHSSADIKMRERVDQVVEMKMKKHLGRDERGKEQRDKSRRIVQLARELESKLKQRANKVRTLQLRMSGKRGG